MTTLPELICCSHNHFLLKKVSPKDLNYIWETAPLEQLFLVTGEVAAEISELEKIMELDWTTWYLMLDPEGHSYGLVRHVPEMNNTISLHGIGWTQKGKSPRVFVLSWYAIHHFLFSFGLKTIKTYCDSKNTNAIKFDLKTGYVYDYCVPTGIMDKKTIHLLIEKNYFEDSMKIKSFIFELSYGSYEISTTPAYVSGQASTNRAKSTKFNLYKLNQKSEFTEFEKENKTRSHFYFFYVIPSPVIYKLSFDKSMIGYLLLSEINGKKKLVVFNSSNLTLDIYLDAVSFILKSLSLGKNDVVILNDETNAHSLKDALTIELKFSGNHTNPKTNIWIVL